MTYSIKLTYGYVYILRHLGRLQYRLMKLYILLHIISIFNIISMDATATIPNYEILYKMIYKVCNKIILELHYSKIHTTIPVNLRYKIHYFHIIMC